MKPIFTIIAVVSLVQNFYSQNINYKVGDTLNVFTLGGLKIRDNPSLSGNVFCTMNLGEKVVVAEVLSGNSAQVIEGFKGNWVKIKYKAFEGFAFDGFLSSLPIPKQGLMKSFNEKRKGEVETDISYQIEKIFAALDAYIVEEFQSICEPVEYYNGADGESYEKLEIQKLSKGGTKITHIGWESDSEELLISHARLAEIKNLIVLLVERSGADSLLFNQIKNGVSDFTEDSPEHQEVLHLESIVIWIKHYPSDFDANSWAMMFTYIGS